MNVALDLRPDISFLGMDLLHPLMLSRQMLALAGTELSVSHAGRIPGNTSLILVSNHRSFMDAPLLMAALNQPIRFACHNYMSQVPILQDLIRHLGCLPLDASPQGQRRFLRQAGNLLRRQEVVGIFPEGAEPMVNYMPPDQVGVFQRGFAHLALKVPAPRVALVPVAIASRREIAPSAFPVRLLSWFDAAEPKFQQPGWHPMVVYQQVHVTVGHPIWISPTQRQAYRGKQARQLADELAQQCHDQIQGLLHGKNRPGIWGEVS
jgi:1-acyl-sn-glycerol-3-phosphate acyltransferase